MTASELFGSLRERLLSRAIINWETGCWEWTGSLKRDGYGRIGVGRAREYRAHRVSYELTFGPIPPGLVIDHLCRVRHCINPAHLEAVTDRVNILRGTGVPVFNALKTHCPQGHGYTPGNTYVSPEGDRKCRTCRTANSAARARARKRVSA